MLRASKRRALAASAFLIGWVAGLVVATAVITVIAATPASHGDSLRRPIVTASWIKIVLGVLLLLLAVKQPAQPAPSPARTPLGAGEDERHRLRHRHRGPGAEISCCRA